MAKSFLDRDLSVTVVMFDSVTLGTYDLKRFSDLDNERFWESILEDGNLENESNYTLEDIDYITID